MNTQMSISPKDNINFYNFFHKHTKRAIKVINNKNFTYENIINILERELSQNKISKVLDYGCGAGTLSFYLAKKGMEVIGFDISDKAINSCKESAIILNLDKNTKFTTKENEIYGKKYDLVICIEVIEHIQNDQKLIEEFKSLLNNSGIVFLSTPSKNAPLFRLKMLKDFDKRVGHLRRYSEGGLRDLFAKSHLSTLKVVKNEGIIRNSLFTIESLGKFVRFIKWPVSTFVNRLDKLFVIIFGESDLILIAEKK